jgi:hypothetical protein
MDWATTATVTFADVQATPMSRMPPCSHKMEFSFLNSNLMAPASQLFMFDCDTFQ